MILIDEEFKSLIPKLSNKEYSQLEDNLLNDGCREPLVLWLASEYDPEDEDSSEMIYLLDGHNRYEICKKNNIEYDVVCYEFQNRDAAKLWIIQNQFGRRNISDFVRAELALQAEPLIVAKAKLNLQATGKNVASITNQGSANLPKLEPIDTRNELSSMSGVSARNISKVKNILETGSEELIDQVRDNNISINAAEILAELPKEEQQEIVARGELEIRRAYKAITEQKSIEKSQKLEQKKEEILKATQKDISENRPVIHESDCNVFLDSIDDESIDLLITDPPYSTDVEDIESFAAGWLFNALDKVKPTGRAYICIGAYPGELLAYLKLLSTQSKFILDNPLIWTYRNTLGITPKNKYNLNYQVILHLYTEESKPLDTSITNEMFSVQDINAPDGRQGNRYHTWQKPDELGIRLVRHSTSDGDKIIDPFACTGTFLIAGAKLNRQVIGCDISKDNLAIAESRGCNVIYQ